MVDPVRYARQQYTNAQARADLAHTTTKTLRSEYTDGRKVLGGLLAYVLTILAAMILLKLVIT